MHALTPIFCIFPFVFIPNSHYMPSLQIRDLPEHLHQALREQAQAQRRSLSQQAIISLARGLDLEPDPRARRRRLIQSFQQRADRWQQLALLDIVARMRQAESL